MISPRTLLLCVLSIVPITAVFGTSMVFPMKPSPPKKYQPPGFVFGIVWTILTLQLGISTALVWHASSKVPISVVILAALLTLVWGLWIVLYNRVDRIVSLAVLVGSCVLAAAHACSVAMIGTGWHQHLSWPLLLSVAWLTFAASLSLDAEKPIGRSLTNVS